MQEYTQLVTGEGKWDQVGTVLSFEEQKLAKTRKKGVTGRGQELDAKQVTQHPQGSSTNRKWASTMSPSSFSFLSPLLTLSSGVCGLSCCLQSPVLGLFVCRGPSSSQGLKCTKFLLLHFLRPLPGSHRPSHPAFPHRRKRHSRRPYFLYPASST